MTNKDTLKERIEYDSAKEKLRPYMSNLINIIESRQRPRPDGSIDWKKTYIDINRLFEHLTEQTRKEMSDKIIKQAEKETDYKTKCGLYLAYDIINNIKENE